MRHLTLLITLLSTLTLLAQNGFYISVGGGASYSSGKLEPLQKSYETYLERAKTSFPNDPLAADESFKVAQIVPNISLQAGFRGEGLLLGGTFQRHIINQSRVALRESGYGRKFAWQEKRTDILFDVGWNGEKIAIIGSFGGTSAKYTMGCYQVYPDGTEDLGNTFSLNGNFRQAETTLAAGLGVKIYPVKYLAIDVRYLYSGIQLPGEDNLATELTLTDNSLSRLQSSNASTEFPADWTQPVGFNNSIPAKFSRSFIQLTVSFDLFIDDL